MSDPKIYLGMQDGKETVTIDFGDANSPRIAQQLLDAGLSQDEFTFMNRGGELAAQVKANAYSAVIDRLTPEQRDRAQFGEPLDIPAKVNDISRMAGELKELADRGFGAADRTALQEAAAAFRDVELGDGRASPPQQGMALQNLDIVNKSEPKTQHPIHTALAYSPLSPNRRIV